MLYWRVCGMLLPFGRVCETWALASSLEKPSRLPRNSEWLGLASSIDWEKFIPYSGSETVAECKTGPGGQTECQWTWLKERKQAERKNVLSGILTPLKTGTRVSFPFFLFTTMVRQGVNGAGNDGPFSSDQSLCFHDHRAVTETICEYRKLMADNKLSLESSELWLKASLEKKKKKRGKKKTPLCQPSLTPLSQRYELNQKKGRLMQNLSRLLM